jgi:hypothetical protein
MRQISLYYRYFHEFNGYAVWEIDTNGNEANFSIFQISRLVPWPNMRAQVFHCVQGVERSMK